LIHGIGIDVVEISRIAEACDRHGERFARRILGEDELNRYFERRGRSPARGLAFLATRFAAKEAISKALGLGMRQPMSWRAVQILNAPSGRPQAVPNAPIARFLRERGLRLHVSMTDERQVAAAYAIAETVDASSASSSAANETRFHA
jgi:holo-[acyl-carrier protein] synthase